MHLKAQQKGAVWAPYRKKSFLDGKRCSAYYAVFFPFFVGFGLCRCRLKIKCTDEVIDKATVIHST